MRTGLLGKIMNFTDFTQNQNCLVTKTEETQMPKKNTEDGHNATRDSIELLGVTNKRKALGRGSIGGKGPNWIVAPLKEDVPFGKGTFLEIHIEYVCDFRNIAPFC